MGQHLSPRYGQVILVSKFFVDLNGLGILRDVYFHVITEGISVGPSIQNGALAATYHTHQLERQKYPKNEEKFCYNPTIVTSLPKNLVVL